MIDRYDNVAVGQWVRELIATGDVHSFYISQVWLNVRDEVLDEDKHECQYCKTHGKYSKATIGHHQKHLRKYPELALSKTYEEDGETKRNIVSVCRECHKLAHPHSIKKAKPLTKERW